jgi:5-methyltetrahydrofolate--homocysteine methyltransferase
VRGLFDGGVDLFIVETCQDILQTKAALPRFLSFFEKQKVKIPVIAQVTIETFGTMLNGTEISAALTALEPFPIDVIGMNCGTGPKQMTESQILCENAPLPVSVLPNAGMPEVKDGAMHYDETPEIFTKQVLHFARISARTSSAAAAELRPNICVGRRKVQNVSPKQREREI